MPLMGTWGGILLLAVLGSVALRWWAQRQARANVMGVPLIQVAYAPVEAASVATPIREALAFAAAEVAPWGFELVGYIQSPEYYPSHPRTDAVLRDPASRAFAIVGFSRSDVAGTIVHFETLFDDGRWLRTVNRRGHFYRSNYADGRVNDALVATVTDQWRAHRDAVDREPGHTPRDVDLPTLVEHLNAVDDEGTRLGVEQGDYEPSPGPAPFRFTRQGADRLIASYQNAAKRLAGAPPLEGILRMRVPVEEQERRYYNVRVIQAHRLEPRGTKAFVISVVAFAASMLLFTNWAWLLWVIPVIMFHELGHWLAMRAFGHRDAKIRFIPFLGAATFTGTRFRKLSHEMIVLLAGSVPGLVLAFALLRFSAFGRARYAMGAAFTLIALNGVNLLPLLPLDGGKILASLVTSGRPHLKVALKWIAAGAFVVAAVAFRDVTLALLGGLGLLLFRSDRRLSVLEARIRRAPDYRPDLTPPVRRRLIFEALADDPKGDPAAWMREVQELEASLDRTTPRWWQAALWGLVYATCLGGVVGWSANVLTLRHRIGDASCPPRARATPLACTAPPSVAGVDWTRADPQSLTLNPFTLARGGQFPLSAFVWCTGKPASVTVAMRELEQVGYARSFCPALPWEPLPAAGKEARDRARFTVRMLASPLRFGDVENRLAQIDKMTATLSTRPMFDAEAARLYRATQGPIEDADASRALAERLGRSPSRSCDHLQVLSFGYERDKTMDDDAAGTSPDVTFRLSVGMSGIVHFERLHDYLCAAGCAVDVLPYGSADPRLLSCY